MAQSGGAAQTIEAYVGETMDNARMGPIHWQGLALVAAGTDWVLAGDGRRVHAQRLLGSDKLSLGAWNLVQIELVNQTARRQRVLLREQPEPSVLPLRIAAVSA